MARPPLSENRLWFAHTFSLPTPWSAPLPSDRGQAFVVTSVFVRMLTQRYGRAVILRDRDRLIARVELDCRIGAQIEEGCKVGWRHHPGVGVKIAKGLLIAPNAVLNLYVAGTDGEPMTVELGGLFPRDVA